MGTVGVKRLELDGRKLDVATPRSGHGTGFAVGAPGLILTAYHVVEGARHIVVRLPGKGGFYSARVVYGDRDADIAILEVAAKIALLAIVSGAEIRVRQSVFTVGYPIDPTRTYPQSARGIVAGQLDDGTLQLDMALNPGNSGGPLLDEKDRVVGMVVARGKVSAGVQGIGYAVPAPKLSAAITKAQQRRGSGGLPGPTARDREAAVVVDELIQQGVLHEVRKSADLKGSFGRADLEKAIDSLTGRIKDADLLVFVAGTLWNGALALEVGGVRKIGTTTLSDDDARRLADRLRSSSKEACRRAVKLDSAVQGRSPFVALALEQRVGPPGARDSDTIISPRTPSPPARFRWEVMARVMPHVRLNPSGRTGLGIGGAVGMARLPSAKGGRSVRWVPWFGGAVGAVSFEAAMPEETIGHFFVVAELGLEARLGADARHIALSAAYTPGLYRSRVEDASGLLAEAQAFTLFHFRAAAAYRIKWIQVGVGARVLSGPTFWLEPVFLGGRF